MTLCCSTTCKKRFECAKSDINNIGTYCVEDFSSFGSGTFTDNGCEIEHYCGNLGHYKLFEPIENKRGEHMGNFVKLITCESGDWEILEVNGVEFASGHSIPAYKWLELLREYCGCAIETECISDEEMELRG